MQRIKTRILARILPALANVKLQHNQHIKGFEINNIKVKLFPKDSNTSVKLLPEKDSIQIYIAELRVGAEADVLYKNFIDCKLYVDGHAPFVAIDGHSTTVQHGVQGQGIWAPYFNVTKVDAAANFLEARFACANQIEQGILNTLEKGIMPIVRKFLEDELIYYLNGQEIRDTINLELNDHGIDNNFPSFTPIKEFRAWVSTLLTGPMKIYSNGIGVPIDWAAYPEGEPYKRYTNCPVLEGIMNPKKMLYDINATLGECSSYSLLKAATEKGFVRKYPLKKNFFGVEGTEIKALESDHMKMKFREGVIEVTLKTGVSVKWSPPIQFICVVKAEIRMERLKNDFPTAVQAESFLATDGLALDLQKNTIYLGDELQRGRMLDGGMLGSEFSGEWNMHMHVTEIIDIESQSPWVPSWLLTYIITNHLDKFFVTDTIIPMKIKKPCISHDICVQNMEVKIHDGFIAAYADFDH